LTFPNQPTAGAGLDQPAPAGSDKKW